MSLLIGFEGLAVSDTNESSGRLRRVLCSEGGGGVLSWLKMSSFPVHVLYLMLFPVGNLFLV